MRALVVNFQPWETTSRCRESVEIMGEVATCVLAKGHIAHHRLMWEGDPAAKGATMSGVRCDCTGGGIGEPDHYADCPVGDQISAAVAGEREACARVALRWAGVKSDEAAFTAMAIAEAIRARKDDA